jgi:hypothetical protein
VLLNFLCIVAVLLNFLYIVTFQTCQHNSLWQLVVEFVKIINERYIWMFWVLSKVTKFYLPSAWCCLLSCSFSWYLNHRNDCVFSISILAYEMLSGVDEYI